MKGFYEMQRQAWRGFKIKSENFELSPLRPDQITDRMLAWFEDPEVSEFFVMPKNMTHEQFVQFLKTYDNKTRFFLVINDRHSGDAIGFFPMYVTYVHGQVKTGICIGEKEYWGRGVVQEIRTAMLDFIFLKMRMHKVFGEVDIRNFPSIFNYKALGFSSEGILRKEQLGQDGKWHDHYRFAILREEWLALKAAKKDA
jgi:RimJ/RimL family protein N-acetyltransferase